ncbi:MAG TPA: MFS transporter [Burkholderiales bacterium]|nr:MFS transporter [Burkholderiales bacterium]
MKTVLVAIAVTLAVQSLTATALIAPSVIAPIAAADLGAAPQSIGLFVSIAYLGAMLSGLATGGLIARFGAFSVCQAAVVTTGVGLALGKLAILALIPVAALLIGIGYGFVNPASSHILARRTPPGIMALVFSIKQTGVPIGGAIAGAVVPTLVLALGWSNTLPVLGAACVAAAFVLLPARAVIADPPAAVDSGATLAPFAIRFRRVVDGMTGPIRLALSHPRLRDLSVVSFGYASAQLVFIAYFVSRLTLDLGHDLVTAGFVYALAHGSGIVGRVVWGAVADHWVSPRITLTLLGVVSAACAALTALFSGAWPIAAITAVAVLYGASAVGWNGVFLAEVARCAPPGQVGTATGGTQFFTFGGAMVGPPVFTALVSATGTYAWGFAFFALVPLAVALRLLVARTSP